MFTKVWKTEQQFNELLKQANEGNTEAQYELALCYKKGSHDYNSDNGFELPKNKSEAFRWMKTSAENGYVKAQASLAIMYRDGNGCETDEYEAVYWFEKAANQGDSESMLQLGLCYKDGIGTEKNQMLAKKWLTIAARRGNPFAKEALAELGDNKYANYKAKEHLDFDSPFRTQMLFKVVDSKDEKSQKKDNNN